MLLADILFLAIVVYLAYRFIFNFLLPIVRATHQVRQQFRDMHGSGGSEATGAPGARPGAGGAARPDAGGAGPGAGGAGPGAARPGSGGGKGSYKPPAEDYIDFEEVK